MRSGGFVNVWREAVAAGWSVGETVPVDTPFSSLLSTLRQKPNTNNGYFSIFTAGSKKTFQKDESSWVRRGEFSIARTLTSLLLF